MGFYIRGNHVKGLVKSIMSYRVVFDSSHFDFTTFVMINIVGDAIEFRSTSKSLEVTL
jgi:hypothetical protein